MQRNLRKTIAGVSQNKRVRAIALEVINGRATVKISGSSRPLYGLPVTGGEVVAGQEVFVDYTSGQPVVSSYREDAPTSETVSRMRTRVVIPDPDVPLSGSDHTHIQAQITDLIHSATYIRGRLVTMTGSPVDGDVITWDDDIDEWVYSAPATTGSLNDLADVSAESPLDGQALIFNSDTGMWEPGEVASSGSTTVFATISSKVLFSIDDTLTVLDNPLRVYNASGITRLLTGVFLSVDTPCSGSSVIRVDIKKNGSSIFSSSDDKPTISSGSYTGFSDALNVTSWEDGSYLTMHVDSKGNEEAGANLVVQVLYSVSQIPVTHGGFVPLNPSITITDQEFFAIEGAVTAGSSPLKIYNTSGSAVTLSKIFLSLETPTGGSGLIVDILKDGESIFTSDDHKPVITAGSYTGETTDIDTTTWGSGESLVMNVENAGNETGENLVVQVVFTKNAGSGEVSSHLQLSDIGVNTHAQIDEALTRLVNTSGSNTGDQVVPRTHGAVENHYLTGYNETTGEFSSGSVVSSGGVTDHTELSNIGSNTHDQIDTALTRLAGTSGSNTGDQDLSSYLTDASSDGKTYGRKDGSWAEITSSGSGGGIEEAPIDGKQYARKDADWSEITSGSSGVSELSDLTDVDTAGATDGQSLVYDGETSKWVPGTVSGGSLEPDIIMIQVFT